MRAGICDAKNALYLRGLQRVEQALAKDKQILECLAVGVVVIDRLPELQELGIVSASQPLCALAEDPQVDEYILSFERAEN